MMSIKSAVILGLVLFLSGPIWGQKISEAFCQKIFKTVILPLKPTKIDLNDAYEDECDFDFVIEDKIDASLSVEEYKTQAESIGSFTSYRSMYCFNEDAEISKSCEQSEKVVRWDDSFIKKSNTNNLFLLRKNLFVINMFSSRLDVLRQMEKQLRVVFFE